VQRRTIAAPDETYSTAVRSGAVLPVNKQFVMVACPPTMKRAAPLDVGPVMPPEIMNPSSMVFPPVLPAVTT